MPITNASPALPSGNFIVGRSAGLIKAVFLHPVYDSLENFLSNQAQCSEQASCGKSYHYVVSSTGKLVKLVDPANTALTFFKNQAVGAVVCPDGFSPCCTIPNSDAIAVGEPVPFDPNRVTLNIAVLISKKSRGVVGCVNPATCLPELEYSGLVELLATLRAAGTITALTPVRINDQSAVDCACPTLATNPIGCLDIVALQAAVAAYVAPTTVDPFCVLTKTIPAGIPTTVIGKDATGKCVIGAIGAGGVLTPASLCIALNGVAVGVPAVGDTVLATNGGVCKLIPVATTTTNLLSNPANAITSTVNGVASTLTPPIGIIVSDIGFDAAGVLVKQVVLNNSFRVTQTLPAGNSVITHNLGLTGLFPSIVEVRDTATGDIVSARVVPGTETANTLTIFLTVPLLLGTVTVIS